MKDCPLLCDLAFQQARRVDDGRRVKSGRAYGSEVSTTAGKLRGLSFPRFTITPSVLKLPPEGRGFDPPKWGQ
jgi:hypothetical protein